MGATLTDRNSRKISQQNSSDRRIQSMGFLPDEEVGAAPTHCWPSWRAAQPDGGDPAVAAQVPQNVWRTCSSGRGGLAYFANRWESW